MVNNENKDIVNGNNANGQDPNGQNRNGQNPNGQNPNGQNSNGQNPNRLNTGRPLFTTTASKNLLEENTKCNWLGDLPIICIGLEDHQIDDKLLLQVLAQSVETQARMCKYYYLEATLTEQETTIYNNQHNRHNRQAYLQILLESVENGTRHMYVIDPVPAAARIKTIGEKIAAMRATQEARLHAAALRDRIPTRIIGAGQVQRELTQQTEEELQQTLADISRATPG